jgi:8-oxo-dGTP pyrophosphatase MutT (NUDIX family)
MNDQNPNSSSNKHANTVHQNINPMSMNKNNNSCNNCGRPGHLFHQCKLPITSYGVILFRPSETGAEYLMIRRKDSFGYIDFMRGKYNPCNLDQLQNIINEMSVLEKYRLQNEPFENLWRLMWGENNSMQYRSEELSSQKKFELVKNGIIIDNEQVCLNDLIERSTTNWKETEWEFPKGRKNYQEKDLVCALREFEEETGYSQEDIKVVENLMPFEEIFIGSNHKSYKHKYYLAYMDRDEKNNAGTLDNFQKSEVSKLEWKSLEQCLESIRPYNLEKKKLIININKVLQEYRLYL